MRYSTPLVPSLVPGMEEKCEKGFPIGNASVPIVKSAQDVRRGEKCIIKIGEVSSVRSKCIFVGHA